MWGSSGSDIQWVVLHTMHTHTHSSNVSSPGAVLISEDHYVVPAAVHLHCPRWVARRPWLAVARKAPRQPDKGQLALGVMAVVEASLSLIEGLQG